MCLLGVKELMEEKVQLQTAIEGQSQFYCVDCVVLLLLSEGLDAAM